jgi:hypothetical protein
VIEVEHLRKHYGEVVAVDDVSPLAVIPHLAVMVTGAVVAFLVSTRVFRFE